MSKTPDLLLGPLPIDIINRTLELELDPGEVIFSAGAQKHAAKNHPNDYGRFLPHIKRAFTSPLYMGDDYINSGKIELIARVQLESSLILVAINVERDEHGRYHVCSFYPISEDKAQSRRDKGFLRIPKR